MGKKGGTIGPICPPGQMYDPLAGRCVSKPDAPEGYFPKKKEKLFKGAGKEIMQPLKKNTGGKISKYYKGGGNVITGR